MTDKTPVGDEIPGLQQVVGKEIVGNAIVLVIISLCSWGLIFHATWGPALGLGTYIGYAACMIPFFTVIQAYIPFINKRADLGKGKWELKLADENAPVETVTNIWSLILAPALLYGIGGTLAVITLMYFSGWLSNEIAVVATVLLIMLATTSLLLREYLPRHLRAYALAVRQGQTHPPQPLAGYLTIEHVIPFFILQAYINACIANRAFHFEMHSAGVDYVPAAALVPDAVITFILLALFQWLFSNNLARGDLRLGRVRGEALKDVNGWTALIMIGIAGALLGIVYTALMSLGGVAGLSVSLAITAKMAVVALSVILGAWVGIRWGGTRENALIRVAD